MAETYTRKTVLESIPENNDNVEDFVELCEWTGSKEELEMVEGADTMLECMDENEGEVWLVLSDKVFTNADKLEFIRHATEYGNGAFYRMTEYRQIRLDLDIWLCDVTKFVFGDFPKTIYLAVTS